MTTATLTAKAKSQQVLTNNLIVSKDISIPHTYCTLQGTYSTTFAQINMKYFESDRVIIFEKISCLTGGKVYTAGLWTATYNRENSRATHRDVMNSDTWAAYELVGKMLAHL